MARRGWAKLGRRIGSSSIETRLIRRTSMQRGAAAVALTSVSVHGDWRACQAMSAYKPISHVDNTVTLESLLIRFLLPNTHLFCHKHKISKTHP